MSHRFPPDSVCSACQMVDTLPDLLRRAKPSEAVVHLMRNAHFLDWPPNDSLWPTDLVQLWEDHRFMCNLHLHVRSSGPGASPTCKFDSIYAEILSQHADLLFDLKTRIVLGDDSSWISALDLTLSVFKPFLVITHWDLPFPHGDSPLDFLQDSWRAGDPDDVAEEVRLIWIHRTKELLLGSDLSMRLLYSSCVVFSHAVFAVNIPQRNHRSLSAESKDTPRT
ncbi:hypothetical protein B0H11DRAFT_1932154 [Mycena galericulata]|nr:hypothetical protein B0H11DRAFT_1932154 [Mycena galericulata]